MIVIDDYLEGLGVLQDYTRALDYFQQAHAAGDAQASVEATGYIDVMNVAASLEPEGYSRSSFEAVMWRADFWLHAPTRACGESLRRYAGAEEGDLCPCWRCFRQQARTRRR